MRVTKMVSEKCFPKKTIFIQSDVPRIVKHEGVILLPELYSPQKGTRKEIVDSDRHVIREIVNSEPWTGLTSNHKHRVENLTKGLLRKKYHLMQDSLLQLKTNGYVEFEEHYGWYWK